MPLTQSFEVPVEHRAQEQICSFCNSSDLGNNILLFLCVHLDKKIITLFIISALLDIYKCINQGC